MGTSSGYRIQGRGFLFPTEITNRICPNAAIGRRDKLKPCYLAGSTPAWGTKRKNTLGCGEAAQRSGL